MKLQVFWCQGDSFSKILAFPHFQQHFFPHSSCKCWGYSSLEIRLSLHCQHLFNSHSSWCWWKSFSKKDFPPPWHFSLPQSWYPSHKTVREQRTHTLNLHPSICWLSSSLRMNFWHLGHLGDFLGQLCIVPEGIDRPQSLHLLNLQPPRWCSNWSSGNDLKQCRHCFLDIWCSFRQSWIVKCVQRYFPLASGVISWTWILRHARRSFQTEIVYSITFICACVAVAVAFFLDNHGFGPALSSSCSDGIVSIGTLSDDSQLLQAQNIWNIVRISSFYVVFWPFPIWGSFWSCLRITASIPRPNESARIL